MRQNVFLILDQSAGLSIRSAVKAWLAERTDRIEVFYLPSYALRADTRTSA